MTLAFAILGLIVSVVTLLVTCVQLFYLESLRIHTRERKSLEFFKETLETKLGLETERGALTFSVVKHLGLGVIGALTLAATIQGAPEWQDVAVACLLVGIFTVMGTYIIPQIVYRKSSGAPCWRWSLSCARSRLRFDPWCGRSSSSSRCLSWMTSRNPTSHSVPKNILKP